MPYNIGVANLSRTWCSTWQWSNLLVYTPNVFEINRINDEIAQACTYTQRHMNNAWSMMLSCSPCFAFSWPFLYYFFLGSHKQYRINVIPLRASVVALFWPYCFSCLFHYINIHYEQSNASTKYCIHLPSLK